MNKNLFFKRLEDNYINKYPSSFFTWASQVCKYKEYEYGQKMLMKWYENIPKSKFILQNTFITLILTNGKDISPIYLNRYFNIINDIKDPVYSLEKIEYTIYDAIGLTNIENEIKKSYNINKYNEWFNFIINNNLYQHAECVLYELSLLNLNYPNTKYLLDKEYRNICYDFEGCVNLDMNSK